MSTETVVVGMSGGVDSSVAALRLLEQGHRVLGLFMKNWEEDDRPGYCAAAEDLADAQAVCDRLGIVLRTVNFASEYWDRVFSYFLDEYRRGRTPNPDVACNSEIKFRAFLDFAIDLGADSIATGHYARLERAGGEPRLLRGVDANKDQSYFLHALSKEQLQRVRFPLGDLHKHDVRELARAAGLPTSEKKDSTGICFIGERRFSTFLKQYLPAQHGDIVTLDGEAVGRHEGLMLYTIGQRKGLNIGGLRGHDERPWYVVDKDLDRNHLIVAQGHDHPQLCSRRLRAGPASWIAGAAPALPLRCTAKIRYRQTDTGCTVANEPGQALTATFDEPVWAAAAGQSIVFYQDQRCLGGAQIN